MSPQKLAERLNKEVDLVIRHLYGDKAKKMGGRYSIGNVQGEEGESLFIYTNSGRWEDRSTGLGGDVLELMTAKYGSKTEAMKVAHTLLNIPQTHKKLDSDKQIKWEKPAKEWSQLTEKTTPKVYKYLTEERKIPIEILRQAGVKANAEDTEYVFIRKTHDDPPVPCGVTYIGVDRVIKEGKEKKAVRQSLKPLDTLYGHDTCKMGVTNAEGNTYVVVTEGQIDMLSLRAVGIKNSVSVPSGSSDLKWIEASWDFLEKFKEIYLFFDNDKSGTQSTEAVAKKLGHDKCRRCVLPDYIKDANAALLESYDLYKAINGAKEFKPSMLASAGELTDEAIKIMAGGKREDQGIPFLGWEGEDSVNFRIRPREMTVITGHPGGGKSTIIYQKVAYLVFVKGKKCFIASLEEEPEVILGLIMVQAIAHNYIADNQKVHRAFLEVGKVLEDHVWFYNHRGRVKAADVLQNAEYCIRKYGVEFVFFDSIAMTDLNIEDNEKCNEFVGLITAAMNETGAHYFLVAHPRKPKDGEDSFAKIPGFHDIKGSSSVGVATFNCITVWRNLAKGVMLAAATRSGKGMFESRKVNDEHGNKRVYSVDEIKQKGDSVLWISKQKVGGQVGRFDLYYNPDCYRLERNVYAESKPYAAEIYAEYLELKVVEEPKF
jgi:twinkle protein